MKRYVNLIRKAVMLLPVVAMTACEVEKESELLPEQVGRICVYTGIQNRENLSPQGEELKACLIFWKEEDYARIFEGTWPTGDPYLTAEPEEEIDFYREEKGIPYDTRHSYPTGGFHVHVMGFAPAGLTTEDYYKTLTVPHDMRNGKWDFLSGDGNSKRTGTAARPFVDKADSETMRKQKQLEFCHLTAKISFVAKRAEDMFQRVGVRNVKVSLKGQHVPTALEWRVMADENKESGYFPTAPEKLPSLELAAPKDEEITLETPQKVDSCYVFTYKDDTHYHAGEEHKPEEGMVELVMDIEAELMPWDAVNGNWNVEQAEKRIWENQSVTVTTTTGNRMKMGYAYEVVITFDIHDLRLQGMEVDWEEGGIHYVPITPVEEEQQQLES